MTADVPMIKHEYSFGVVLEFSTAIRSLPSFSADNAAIRCVAFTGNQTIRLSLDVFPAPRLKYQLQQSEQVKRSPALRSAAYSAARNA